MRYRPLLSTPAQLPALPLTSAQHVLALAVLRPYDEQEIAGRKPGRLLEELAERRLVHKMQAVGHLRHAQAGVAEQHFGFQHHGPGQPLAGRLTGGLLHRFAQVVGRYAEPLRVESDAPLRPAVVLNQFLKLGCQLLGPRLACGGYLMVLRVDGLRFVKQHLHHMLEYLGLACRRAGFFKVQQLQGGFDLLLLGERDRKCVPDHGVKK